MIKSWHCLESLVVATKLSFLRQNMFHMQHHFLCNISYVVIAASMGESLKYTTKAGRPLKSSIFGSERELRLSLCDDPIPPAILLYYNIEQ